MKYYRDSLCHHGVKGQKWGQRKTPRRKNRSNDYDDDDYYRPPKKSHTVLKAGAIAVGTVLAVYGAYKLSSYAKYELGRKHVETGKDFVDKVASEAVPKAKKQSGIEEAAKKAAKAVTNKASSAVHKIFKGKEHYEQLSLDVGPVTNKSAATKELLSKALSKISKKSKPVVDGEKILNDNKDLLNESFSFISEGLEDLKK